MDNAQFILLYVSGNIIGFLLQQLWVISIVGLFNELEEIANRAKLQRAMYDQQKETRQKQFIEVAIRTCRINAIAEITLRRNRGEIAGA